MRHKKAVLQFLEENYNTINSLMSPEERKALGDVVGIIETEIKKQIRDEEKAAKESSIYLETSIIEALETVWINVLSRSPITKEIAFSNIKEMPGKELALLQEKGRRTLLQRIKSNYITDDPIFKGTSHEELFNEEEFIAVTSLFVLFEREGFSFECFHMKALELSDLQKENLCRLLAHFIIQGSEKSLEEENI